MLASCASDFGSHLETSMRNNEGTELAGAKNYRIVYTDFSSRKIRYAYEKLFRSNVTYAEYTSNKEYVEDTTTKGLIAKRLESIGMTEEKSQEVGTLEISYEEIMGWDFGEIVKQMRICGSVNSTIKKPVECVEFSELKMANTHPTRELVVNNLIAILLTKNWPAAAPNNKYKRFEME